MILLGTAVASGWSLPGDSLVLPVGLDSTRVRAEGDRVQGRTLLRHRIEWIQVTDQGQMRLSDTSLFRFAGDPGMWAGESFLHAGWAQREDSGWGASWMLWNRTNGLGAREASLSENAWRQKVLARLALGDSSLSGAVSLGGLLERADPGSASQGITSTELPPKGVYGAGTWSMEGRWAGGRETPSLLSGQWSDLFQGSSLRQSRTAIGGSIQASLAGEGRDTARLEASHDSVRQRSIYLLTDRSDVHRYAGASWILPIGNHRLMVAAAWDQNRYEDYSGRNPWLIKTGSEFGGGIQGPIGAGWKHGHGFQWSQAERIWQTPGTGDLLAAELQAAQDRRDRDNTVEYMLADTLGWHTERWGGVGFDLGLLQALRSTRHPLNQTPTQVDRPDEDVSKRQFLVDLRWDRMAWNGKPILSWTSFQQEDVYLKAVHSARTWAREENRLGFNIAIPFTAWIRPDLGFWAREQRNSWRFLADRREGLLEYGVVWGGEAGPVDAPWVSLQWSRWQVKTGGIVGEDFAPDRIQDEWLPDLRGYVRWGSGWTFEPWLGGQLERVTIWDGSDWVSDNRSRTMRWGGDLLWELSHGGVQGSVGRVWNDPGENVWIGSASARWAW